MDQASFLNGIEILDSSLATSSTASLYTYGGISIFNTSTASNINSSFLTLGGVNIAKNTIIGGDTVINSTTNSTNTTTGSLLIAGGIGIQGSIYGNFSNFSNIQILNNATLTNLITTNASIGTLSSSTFNPSNITTNNLVVTSSTITNCILTNITTTNITLTSLSTILSGNIGSTLRVNSTINTTNTSTGALIVSGGAGFNGDIYANNIYSNGILLGKTNNVLGSNYNYAFIEAASGSTSNTFQLRMSLTTGNLTPGYYHIHTGYYMFSNSSTNQNSEFRSLLDSTSISTGTLLHNSVFRPNNITEIHPFYEINTVLLTSGIHTLSIIFRNQSNGGVTNISNTKLELYKIS